ncbi:MAG TPA: LysM peptidoglycan-binding domain-containing protein [Bacillota bacterium]|nr:LysM peptidoglycan-binding domain-containing protein [Bacillota bacterium]
MQQYVVKPNDTLYLIAHEFNVPLAQLIKANPQISNPDMIFEGQTITIPDLPAVPNQIGVLQSNAVNIINDIFHLDWESADNGINTLRTAMNSVVTALQQAQVPNNTIFDLNAAIRALEQNATQRRTYPAISQANRVTQLIADVLDYFNVVFPPDVLRLAYFARQAIVNVDQNDWAEAEQNYRRALEVWQRLRPQLVDNYVTDVANVDQTLGDLRDSISRRDYLTAINSANRILELNNIIMADFEQLYT